jgi:hypothetical protein
MDDDAVLPDDLRGSDQPAVADILLLEGVENSFSKYGKPSIWIELHG